MHTRGAKVLAAMPPCPPPLPAPRTPEERHELGERWLAAMRRGDFEAAWRETDRLELPRRAQGTREAHHLQWDGQPLAGRRVLVRCEHGLGDALQFLRYGARLHALGSEVTLKVPPALVSLLSGTPGIARVYDGWTTDPEPEHDVAIECMELPYAFRDTTATLPASVPYLAVKAIRQRAQLPALPGGTGLKVGLMWAASAWDDSRSLRLAEFAPLVGAARCFSLQQGPELAQLASAPFVIENLSRHTESLVEAAAALLGLDLLITADGMLAHLAGALGRPVWVLLKHDADWRWMAARTDSPWYPTMRLFRQPSPGTWAPAIRQIAEELHRKSPPGER